MTVQNQSMCMSKERWTQGESLPISNSLVCTEPSIGGIDNQNCHHVHYKTVTRKDYDGIPGNSARKHTIW